MSSFKYTGMLVCALAILFVGPASAFAGDDDSNSIPRRTVVTTPPLRSGELPGLVTDANLPVLMHPGSPRPEVESPRRLPFGYPPIPTGPL